MSAPSGSDGARQQGIAATITEVSERASVLIREEIELAKTEITEKAMRLAKGAVVAVVAGVFFLTALFFVLIGLAWLLYYELPIGNEFTYFWGFFAMAVILIVLGALAGWLAARAVKAGAPPVPEMAIAEARKIRETVGSKPEAGGSGAMPSGTGAGASSPGEASAAQDTVDFAAGGASGSSQSAPPSSTGSDPDSELGRGAIDGATLGR